MNQLWKVPGKKIMWRNTGHGPETTSDGKEWSFTFRSLSEWREMFPTAIPVTTQPGEEDREIYGDTLDEPIPDDLWEML